MNTEPERIAPLDIANKIHSVDYINANLITFCIIKMLSGFVVTGQSACARLSDFNREKGEKLAYRDAFSKLFLMEQYLSRDAAYTKAQQEITT